MNAAFIQRNHIFMTGLLLFSLSIALSKSATNVLIGIIYLTAIFFIIKDQSFRNVVTKNARQPLLLPVLLYLGVAVLGLLFTQDFSHGRGIVNKLSGLLFVYFMFSLLLDSMTSDEERHRKAELLLAAFLIGVLVLDLIGILTYLGAIGNKKDVLPLAPRHVHHIWFSNLNAIGIYVAFAFLFFSKHRVRTGAKIYLYSFILIAIICILLSQSRTAWFGILLTSVIMTYFIFKNRQYFFITIAIGAILCIMLYSFSPIVSSRIDLIISDISQFLAGHTFTSLGLRFLMWKASFMMFLSNPLLGVGTGDYGATVGSLVKTGLMPEFLLEFNQPHNMYLFVLATNGLLGIIVFLFVFYRALNFSMPILRKPEGPGRIFAFLATATAVHFMIAGLTDSLFNIQILRYTFAFVMGVCIRSSLKSARSS